jgi:hypothetical protein
MNKYNVISSYGLNLSPVEKAKRLFAPGVFECFAELGQETCGYLFITGEYIFPLVNQSKNILIDIRAINTPFGSSIIQSFIVTSPEKIWITSYLFDLTNCSDLIFLHQLSISESVNLTFFNATKSLVYKESFTQSESDHENVNLLIKDSLQWDAKLTKLDFYKTFSFVKDNISPEQVVPSLEFNDVQAIMQLSGEITL